MAYRDEREALQNQVAKLEVDLDEAKRNAAGDEALRARSEKLEAEIAALRRNADRLEAELREIRPARPRSGVGSLAALAIAGAAVVGLAVAGCIVAVVALRGASSPPPPPREVAVAPDLTRPPAPPFTPSDIPAPDPEPPAGVMNPGEASPAAPSNREGKARWAATVKRAEGNVAAKGSTCFIDATLHTIGTNEEWPDVVVTCGATKIYDSSASLNGMAMTSADPLERFAKADGQSVFTLKYEDKGTRGSSKNQIMLDTTKGLGVVWSENLPAFRVELAVPVESAPAPPVAERLARDGAVSEATGNAPVKTGGHCTLRAFANGAHETCIAAITCDGRAIVKASDAVSCTYEGTVPKSVSRASDSLSLTIEGDGANISAPGDKGFTIKLALDGAR